MWIMNYKITIVVWRGVIVDYNMVTNLIGSGELVRPATQEEIKQYWNRPEKTNDNVE
jgi:hypothetical protein